ncbi:hypothetical protein B0H34DRAFT_797929 [Crassisporium funariophilum]|nr:hypothetical protein B0H34DRAFT_797929 [Crassisporium funariophilum]
MSPSPWPQPTPPPTPSSSSTSRRRRQVITDQTQVNQALTDCQINSGNDVFSCFPTADTTVPQREWASFVWNSRRPELTQTNLVDVFLFRADSQQQLLHFRHLPNPSDQAGLIRTQVNDTWFGADGLNWSGRNVSFPYYWVILRSDKSLDGNQAPQPIFTAVQTTVLDSVATAASIASVASLSAASLTLTPTTGAAPTSGAGNVQRPSNASSFPRWAIAVIVVLGFLAIAATCILAFLILRRIRRRAEIESNRNSMGSASPMMPRDPNNATNTPHDMVQRYDSLGTPLLPPTMALAGGASSTRHTHHTNDAASMSSDAGGPFSGADAAIIADAFRKKLRQPDFAGRPVEEGDSPEAGGEHEGEMEREEEKAVPASVVLSRELAEEGRDIRSVSSSRGVKVETQPESGETRSR